MKRGKVSPLLAIPGIFFLVDLYALPSPLCRVPYTLYSLFKAKLVGEEGSC